MAVLVDYHISITRQRSLLRRMLTARASRVAVRVLSVPAGIAVWELIVR